MLDPLHPDKRNIVTKFYLSRINREGDVVKYMLKCKKNNEMFLQSFNQFNLATSDQNLTIYDSLDSTCQVASDPSIFMSLGLMDGKLYVFFCF